MSDARAAVTVAAGARTKVIARLVDHPRYPGRHVLVHRRRTHSFAFDETRATIAELLADAGLLLRDDNTVTRQQPTKPKRGRPIDQRPPPAGAGK